MNKLFIVSLLSVILFSCQNQNHEQILIEYQFTLKDLQASLDSLNRQEEISESYLITEKLNQVVRSEAEKERQLQNLNEYQREIQKRIEEVQDSIKLYSASVSLLKSYR